MDGEHVPGETREEGEKSPTKRLLDIQPIWPAKTPVETFHKHANPVFTKVGLGERVGGWNTYPAGGGGEGKEAPDRNPGARAISPPGYLLKA